MNNKHGEKQLLTLFQGDPGDNWGTLSAASDKPSSLLVRYSFPRKDFTLLTGQGEPWDLTLSQLGLGPGCFLSAFKYTYNISELFWEFDDDLWHIFKLKRQITNLLFEYNMVWTLFLKLRFLVSVCAERSGRIWLRFGVWYFLTASKSSLFPVPHLCFDTTWSSRTCRRYNKHCCREASHIFQSRCGRSFLPSTGNDGDTTYSNPFSI